MDVAAGSHARRGAPFFFGALAALSIDRIRSYDYFWHLASGRWIAEHLKIPHSDPFALASSRAAWVDGEWLFQLILYPLHRVADDAGISVVRALVVAAIFTIGFVHASRFVSAPIAAMIASLGWYGANPLLGARPSTAAALLLSLAIVILSAEVPLRIRLTLWLVLTVIWINVHPSALLAPVLAGAWWVGELFSGRTGRSGRSYLEGLTLAGGSAAALLVNPYGPNGVIAPVELLRTIRGESFVNAEWLPSSPLLFPLLYISGLLAVVCFISSGSRRSALPQAILLLLLGYLAVRHVRNQGLYFSALPLLVAPVVPAVRRARLRALGWLVTGVAMSMGLIATGFGLGIDRSVFPRKAVDELSRSGLEGNIFNPDQFGGYLIWSFYPQRRVLVDGRNELFVEYLREYERARLDGRLWNALLDRYRITIAVDEYHRETLDVIDARTGERKHLPISSIYFPRERWALIAFDDVAMVFARRDAYPARLLEKMEYRLLVPDADRIDFRDADLGRFQDELNRARRRLGDSRVLDRLETLTKRRRFRGEVIR